MRIRPNAVVSIALAVVAGAPSVALACPVCGLGNGGDSEWAYTTMSVMLSALPLGMMVAGTVWLSRRVKKADEEAARGPGKGSDQNPA